MYQFVERIACEYTNKQKRFYETCKKNIDKEIYIYKYR